MCNTLRRVVQQHIDAEHDQQHAGQALDGGQPARAEKRWRNAACSRISAVAAQASTTAR